MTNQESSDITKQKFSEGVIQHFADLVEYKAYTFWLDPTILKKNQKESSYYNHNPQKLDYDNWIKKSELMKSLNLEERDKVIKSLNKLAETVTLSRKEYLEKNKWDKFMFKLIFGERLGFMTQPRDENKKIYLEQNNIDASKKYFVGDLIINEIRNHLQKAVMRHEARRIVQKGQKKIGNNQELLTIKEITGFLDETHKTAIDEVHKIRLKQKELKQQKSIPLDKTTIENMVQNKLKEVYDRHPKIIEAITALDSKVMKNDITKAINKEIYAIVRKDIASETLFEKFVDMGKNIGNKFKSVFQGTPQEHKVNAAVKEFAKHVGKNILNGLVIKAPEKVIAPTQNENAIASPINTPRDLRRNPSQSTISI